MAYLSPQTVLWPFQTYFWHHSSVCSLFSIITTTHSNALLEKNNHFNQIQFPTKSNFSSRYFRPGSSRGRSRNKFLLAVKKIIHWKCRLDKWPFITDGLAGTWKFIYMHSFDTYSNLSISFPLNVFPVDVFIIITNLSDQSDFFFFIRFGFPERKKLFCGVSSKINNNSNLKTQQN